MAVERDPGSTGKSDPKTTETQPDPRDVKLREAEERAVAAEKKYTDDMAQVQAALQDPDTINALAARVKSKKTEDPDDGDETTLVDRKELRRHSAELAKTFANVLGETTTQSARQLRSAQKELLRPKLKHFARYEKEIDALLDKVDARQAASPDTITSVYNLVTSQHQEELATEREKEIRDQVKEEFRSRGMTLDEDELQEEVETRAEENEREPERKTTPARRPSVAPAETSSSRSIVRHREAASTWKNQDEKTAAGIFGIKSADEFRRYGDKNWKPDILGFRGRERV